MSDLARFAAMALPDVIEAGGKSVLLSSGALNEKPRIRRRRLTVPPGFPQPPPSLGKQESAVTTPNPNPTLEEVQASLDATLAKFVDDQKTPERRAEMLIKIASYRTDLAKYAPVLIDADDDLVEQILGGWLDAGDGELKKALWNQAAGSVEIPLAKAAPASALEALAKMVDAVDEGPRRMNYMQKIGFYSNQFDRILQAEDPGQAGKIQTAALTKAWIEDGDGSHAELKKAIAAAAGEMQELNKDHPAKEVVGNASTHAGSQMGGSETNAAPSKVRTTIPSRSSEAGAGGRLDGQFAAPNQADGETPTPGSGPNDTGDGGVKPSVVIRRKGTTGGLGSVRGEVRGEGVSVSSQGKDGLTTDKDDIDPKTGKARKKSITKSEDLVTDLIKIAPDAMIQALSNIPEEDQLAVCEEAATHAADLTAWHASTGDRLAKAELDSAITDWLGADPDPGVIQLKKWTAEALGTSEDIPIGLAKAIMAWEPPKAAPTVLRASGVRVRQPMPVA